MDVKTFHSALRSIFGIAILLMTGPAARAQTAPVMQGDVAGTIGWLAVDKESQQPQVRHDWTKSLWGAASAGWYWTDHLKTEVDFGAGSRATAYESRTVTFEGRPVYTFTESSFARRTL